MKVRAVQFNRENLSFAFANILAHKFRSLLTVLGIIVGIVTVILVASVLNGVRQNIVLLFQEFGPNNIFVFHLQGDPYNPALRPEELTRKPLRVEYAPLLVQACPSLQDAAAQILVPNIIGNRPITARYQGLENDRILIQGCTWNFSAVTNGELKTGRVFTLDEEKRRARVCVIGANIEESLFPDRNPLGRNIQIDGALYQVLGVFEKRKGNFFGENRQDNVVMIPATTIRSRYPFLDPVVLYCQARPGLRDKALEEVETELRRLRNRTATQESDFHMSTADQIIQQFDRVTSMVRIATLTISGLGLLVGGIGVMNIMLMSVTQRTREIGVRKAIGARRRDIVLQFLLEATLLTGMGGILGVVFASILGILVSWAVGLPATPPVWAILAGLSVSGAVGLVFGVWPALKASRLDPVESLHYE